MKVALDTNILLLLVVGLSDARWIAQHKRLSAYTVEDFVLLVEQLGESEILSIPHSMTETDNILKGGLREPAGSILRETLAAMVQRFDEHYVPTKQIVTTDEYRWLGIGDTAWLETLPDGATLITDDLNLFAAALGRGIDAINFNHLRDGVTV